MSRRAAYRELRLAAAGALAGYFALGMLTLRRTEYDHIYPVFAWNMFSLVPSRVERYDARVSVNGGRPLRPAPPLESLCPPGGAAPARVLLQNWGEAIADGDAERAEGTRRRVEAECLRPSARYELFEESSAPVQAYLGAPGSRRSLGVFSLEAGR